MNIVLIMTDQQRWDSVASIAGGDIKTPNTDAVASDGVIFENAYSSCPACVPARGCLLTGLNQYNLGSLTYGAALKPDYPVTLPKLLKKQGYKTVAVGKNHFTPQRAMHGYDEIYLDESARVESADFVSDYMAWFKSRTGHEQIIPDYMDFNGFNGSPYVYDESLHPTSWVRDKAKEKLSELCRGDEPWFLKISFARPHSPYDPPKRWFDYYYNKSDLPMPVKSKWSEKFRTVRGGLTRWCGEASPEENRKTRAGYFGSVSFIDEAIGEITALMKEKGVYDDALIIFTSDHGDMLGDHNLWRKTYAYEGSAHIPMIIKPPAGSGESGGVSKTPCSLYDVLPTVMGMVNPRESFYSDGINLFREKREYIHGEYICGYERNMDMHFVCDGKYKLIWYIRTGRTELFDLEADPYETENLSGSGQYSEICGKLTDCIAKVMSERGVNVKKRRGGLRKYPFRLPYGMYGIDSEKHGKR